jgi:hypothetical protein
MATHMPSIFNQLLEGKWYWISNQRIEAKLRLTGIAYLHYIGVEHNDINGKSKLK